MGRVTVKTIAEAVGVSPSTVSNAYNRPDQLSAELRERILAVAADLGYADQAHLTRECRRLAGRTPSEPVASRAAAAGERLLARA